MILIIFLLQVVLGTLLAALVPVVGFNAVMTSEHFASFLVSLCLIVCVACVSMLYTMYAFIHFLLFLQLQFLMLELIWP